ncbi:MAG: chitobiase/beta-hexosaminidase C-terminal domain-containing protein, partial [Anaerolineae bacterium]
MHPREGGRRQAASFLIAAVVGLAAAGAYAPGAAADGAGRLFLPALLQEGIPAPPVIASPGRGIYLDPIVVSLSTSNPEATIFYTTDGRVPTPDTGLVYRGPFPVAGTTVLRAVAILPRRPPSATLTQTYVFPADTVRQPRKPPGLPRSWGFTGDGDIVEADYEMDRRVAVADPRYRDRIVSDLMSLPSVSVVTRPADMFAPEGIYSNPTEAGRPWERPASVELIYPSGKPGFQVDCGIRIAGDYSRDPEANRKHSFSLRFRKEYGAEKLRYPLFPDSSVEVFDALRLRAGQADSFEFFPRKAQYIHDQWGRDTQRAMGSPAAHGEFVHLYVNGLYWGLYNLAQEVDAEFAAQTYGGHKDDYDVIKQDIDLGPRVEHGDKTAFEAMLAIDDLGSPEGWAEIQEYLDVVQYVDYTILEFYGA